MNYYIYENWVAEGHKARIHVGSCSYCKEGKGIHPGAGNRNGKWHGPFPTLDEARIVASKTQGKISYCKHCKPE